jgi:16S rRNA (cytosine967-C5)-methyltransferase
MQDRRGKPHSSDRRPRFKTGQRAPAGKAKPSASPQRAPRPGFAARRLAVGLIAAVIERGQSFEQHWANLAKSVEFVELEPRDRAFVRLLAATTLRRQGELEHVVKAFLEKPLPDDRGLLWPILLSGAAQLVCLGLPAHAVVDLCVELARADRGARRFDKLTNAVMRRVSERGAALLADADRVRLNTPDWLLARWADAYGAETAHRIAEASLREAPNDLSLKPMPPEAAAAFAQSIAALVLPTGTLRLTTHGRIEDLPGFAEGQWWVQDAAAALVSRVLGNVAGLEVADLCAAPGGKTASLASAGAKVTAVDLSEKRLGRLRENMQRLSLEVEVVAADVATWSPSRQFDAVLLDAPCSSTGTVRRHPDLLRQKTFADIERLVPLQARLLESAAHLVKPGGVLVYSTCSLEPEEGVSQVAAFLAAHAEFTREPIDATAIRADAAWLTPLGELRTLPFHLPLDPPELSGMDGFYVARLRRAS